MFTSPVKSIFLSLFTSNMAGQLFEGHGVLGYDTKKKKYVSVWVDGSRTELNTMEATMQGTTRMGTTMMMSTRTRHREPADTRRRLIGRGSSCQTMNRALDLVGKR